ncbi:MAG: M48 family metalloprotease [Alphaproteobacteria bacterium]|nr:M48 family metalloprotease [Alphaproteobacteria bacterium]
MQPLLDAERLREHRQRNIMHSILLIGGIGAILAVATTLLWGIAGIAVSLIGVGLLVLFAPSVPAAAVMRLYSARKVEPGSDQLSRVVDELAQRAELPARPGLYVIPSATLNAFATGNPQNASIAVTEGLLRRLTMREIATVIAHEMSHIRNNDLWLMNLADVMTRLVQSLSYVALALAIMNVFGMLTGEAPISWWAVLALYVAPAFSSLLQLGLSRAREFDADLEAAMLTGDPMGLASALSRLEHYQGQFWEDLVYPVPARRVPQPSLLRTHPATEERIDRLRELAGSPSLPQIVVRDEPMVSMLGLGPIEMRPRYRFPGLWY